MIKSDVILQLFVDRYMTTQTTFHNETVVLRRWNVINVGNELMIQENPSLFGRALTKGCLSATKSLIILTLCNKNLIYQRE